MLVELALCSAATTYYLAKRKKNTASKLVSAQAPEKTLESTTFSSKKLLHDFKSAIFGDEREQLQLALNPEIKAEVEKRKKEENRSLVLYSSMAGLAFLGAVYPTFRLLGIGAVLYLARNTFFSIWRDAQKGHISGVYITSAALSLGLIATGRLALAAFTSLVGRSMVELVERVEENSQKHLVNVFSGHATYVWLEKEGVEIQTEFVKIKKGDCVIVNAGETIPVDGIIQSGLASIDQHILTGESQPVELASGDKVFAATLLLSGRITILVETAGEDTVAANIGNVLNNTKNYKDTLMLRGKKIADSLILIELGVSVLTLATFGPTAALAILYSGLGLRMMMYGPLSVLNYLQVFSQQGILIKDGRVLELLREVDTIVFDKTGTLTLEQPSIGKIHTLGGYDENTLLGYAAAAEYRQLHPIAKAIVEKAQERSLSLSIPEEASYEVGYGIKVELGGKVIRVGSARFMLREEIALPTVINDIQQHAEALGHSLIYIGIDDNLGGVLEMQPSIRPEAHQLVQSLQQRGLKVYIISGDHEQPTRNIAEQLGVDHYFAETLPENKANLVKQLREQGKFVCFVGDGINDAIALKSAQLSISLKGASSAATDTAQIIFMDGTLASLSQLFQLSDEFEDTMRSNLMLSIIPGVTNIGGVYLLHFGLATSMSIFYGSSLVGLANSMLPLAKHQENKITLEHKKNNE